MAATEPSSQSSQSTDDGKPDIKSWMLKTAGAIIGSLGLGGAMAVIGSAVLWVRFKEAGLPAMQAVSVQPQHEALVQGAQVSVFFVLVAVAAVVALYVSDFRPSDDAKAADDARNATQTEPGEKREIAKRTKGFLLVLPVAGVVWLLTTNLSCWWKLGLSVLALVLWWGCRWIGVSESKNFWALAAAVFVAVVVFSGAASYAIVQDQKFVQAVAILRGEDDTGLTGYYVAVTDDKVYFANAIGAEGETNPEGKPMQEVALGEGVTYSIGPLESQEDATARAPAMLNRLIADRESAKGPHEPEAVDFPEWVPEDKLATFTADATPHEGTSESLCMMRYLEEGKGTEKGEWWTSCKEAEALETVFDVRERLATPRRFQKSYDIRVKVEVPAGTDIRYVEGGTAPQCGGAPGGPCGHRYPGGGLQYWIDNPDVMPDASRECTAAAPDEVSEWSAC